LTVSCRAMNRLFLIITALLCVSAFAQTIQACECREYGTPICARFWRSDAVFVGQVVDIKPLRKKPDNVYTYVLVSFMVQESFRGVSGPKVAVGAVTNTHSAIHTLRKVSGTSSTHRSTKKPTNCSAVECVPGQLWLSTSMRV